MELAILDLIQKIHNPLLDCLMLVVTTLGDGGFIWILTGILLLCCKKTRRTGFCTLLVLLSGFLVGNLLLKNLVARPRPFLANPAAALLLPPPEGFSFPSGHALSSFGAGVFLYLSDRKWGRLALILAFFIAFSRPYLYVHYVSDMMAGMIIGTSLAFLVKFLEKRWLRSLEEGE